MRHFRTLQDLSLEASWVTIGSFDGVHRGHQEIFRRMVGHAHESNHPVVAVTFSPHPMTVLRGKNGPLYLTTDEEKACLLGELEVDYVITLEFNQQLASLSAFDFMNLLSRHLNLKHLWIGYDFALGKEREGDIKRLAEIGKILGYEVEVISPVIFDGQVVSSSRIRSLIQEGKVETAADLLGRYYSITRPIIHGDGRGHNLGFPTANLEPCEACIVPGNGIYATYAYLEGRRYLSATNVGFRPTFTSQPPVPLIETFFLDFNQEIYGKPVKLEFVRFLRHELRFSTVNELRDQMKKDAMTAREVLIHEQPSPGVFAESPGTRS